MLEPTDFSRVEFQCGSQVIVDKKAHQVMDPQYLLPFKLEKQQATELFRAWIQKRWLAPNTLKKRATVSAPLVGVYFPFWTFDAQTESDYTGEQGIDHIECYQTKDAQGNTVERTKTVTHWHYVSGAVQLNFDDLLIPGSNALSKQLTSKLQEWDLKNLLPYRNDYLAGYHGETYTKELNQSYDEATRIMKVEIEAAVRRDIGGNHQRIHQVNTKFSDVTFKYVLLPIWILVYKHKQEYYKVLINGRTGELEGERPYSVIKIICLSLIVIALVIWLYLRYNR